MFIMIYEPRYKRRLSFHSNTKLCKYLIEKIDEQSIKHLLDVNQFLEVVTCYFIWIFCRTKVQQIPLLENSFAPAKVCTFSYVWRTLWTRKRISVIKKKKNQRIM